jgi:hypothetical protein
MAVMMFSFPAPQFGPVLHVDVEDPLEQPRPVETVRPGLNRLGGFGALGEPCCFS